MNKKLVLLIVVIIIYIIITNWNCRPDYNIKNRKCNENISLTKDGIFYIENFLPKNKHLELKKKFKKNYNTNTIEIDIKKTFLDKKYFLNFLKKITKQPNLINVKKNDNRQAWLRYYNQNMFNPYENTHIDRKRYECDSYQYRVVYCIHNDSDAYFTAFQPNCKKDLVIPTKENSLIIIEAENLLHKMSLSKGNRLMLMADYTTSHNRGIHGSLVYLWDYLWFRIQILLTMN